MSKTSIIPAVLAIWIGTFDVSAVGAFEGRITATVTRGGETQTFLYTIGTNQLRIERTETNWPHAKNIVDLDTGATTILFPHNRSFVRLKPATENSSTPTGFLQMPRGLPPGVGPQSQSSGTPVTPTGLPPGIGPTNLPGRPTMPPVMPAPPAGLPPGVGPQAQPSTVPGAQAVPNLGVAGGTPSMPAMPMPIENMELKATGEKTNLLGFACEKFEIKQHGDVLEVWATDQLLPFQSYVRNQTRRFGPRMIEESWAGLLTAKKLFPLRASLRFDNGTERYRFEVQSVTPQKLKEEDTKLFQPPAGYFETQPLQL